MIVKLQRPLNDPTQPWLAYNRTRIVRRFIPPDEVPKEVIKAMGHDAKAYFMVAFGSTDQRILFGKRVDDQDW